MAMFDFDKELRGLSSQLTSMMNGIESKMVEAVGGDLSEDKLRKLSAAVKLGDVEAIKRIVEEGKGKISADEIQSAVNAFHDSGIMEVNLRLQREMMDLKRKMSAY